MGYGVPAAVGAKRTRPERMVVSFAGDGCFLMNGQEFATAVQYGLAIVFIVIDNAMYGTIRMHQEREYPGARHRDRAEEPRLRRLCARLRRPRRDGRGDGGFRAGVRARGRFRQARDPSREDRSGGDHADDDAVRDPPTRAGGPSGLSALDDFLHLRLIPRGMTGEADPALRGFPRRHSETRDGARLPAGRRCADRRSRARPSARRGA